MLLKEARDLKLELLPYVRDLFKGETVMADGEPINTVAPATAVKPDVPAGQSIAAAVESAYEAGKAVSADPSLSTAGAAVNAVDSVLGNPTVKALEADLPPLVRESKAGYKTTEFWGAVAAAVTDVSTTLPASDKVALLALSGVYAVARGIAKNGIPFISAPGAPQ